MVCPIILAIPLRDLQKKPFFCFAKYALFTFPGTTPNATSHNFFLQKIHLLGSPRETISFNISKISYFKNSFDSPKKNVPPPIPVPPTCCELFSTTETQKVLLFKGTQVLKFFSLKTFLLFQSHQSDIFSKKMPCHSL